MMSNLVYTNKFTHRYITEDGRIVKKEKIAFYECMKCHTAYPVLQGVISCNGLAIKNCPYCEGERGVVEDVKKFPENSEVIVEIRDYDILDDEDESMRTDEKGEAYGLTQY